MGDQIVAGMAMIAMAAGVVRYFWRHRNDKKEDTEQLTPEEQSVQAYGFDFFSVSNRISNAVQIREKLEVLQKMQIKIDMSRTDLYRENRVFQIQWYDWNACCYVTYDLPLSGQCSNNADLMEALIDAEKQRLSTSLFREVEKIHDYGEVKTVDKTERGAGERETVEC